MKINWPTAIILAFIGFISFIMYFIITMNVDKKYDHDLVIENYYQQEVAFQNEMEKESNANSLEENLTWTKTDEGISIKFPEKFDQTLITGKVFLYRPSNKQFDFEMPISLSNHSLLIPNNRLLDGRWNIKVDWQYNNNSYMYKKEIVY